MDRIKREIRMITKNVKSHRCENFDFDKFLFRRSSGFACCPTMPMMHAMKVEVAQWWMSQPLRWQN
jgi:hypothetical protein